MRLIILHAGKGSRLSPLTNELPKGFIPVRNVSPLQKTLNSVKGKTTEQAITITPGDELVPALITKYNLDLKVIEGDKELALKPVLDFLKEKDEPVMVWWGDTIASVDIEAMIASHKQSGAPATMALWRTSDLRELKHWGGVTLGLNGRTNGHPVPELSKVGLIKCGVFIFEPSISTKLELLSKKSWDMSYMLNTLLLDGDFNGYVFDGYSINLNYGYDLIKAGCNIGGYEGSLEPVIGENVSKAGRLGFGPNVSVGDDVILENGAYLSNCVVLGGAKIGENSTVVDSVIGPGATVGPDAFIRRKMVTRNSEVELNESPY